MLRKDRQQPLVRQGTNAEEWTQVFARKRGWRIADGGKSIGLANGQSMWIWGDTWASNDAGDRWFVLGSTIALSGSDPSEPIEFFGRIATFANGEPDPTDSILVDLSSGAGVDELRDLAGERPVGAWEWTGLEHHVEAGKDQPQIFDQGRFLWVNCAAALGSTAVFIYAGMNACSSCEVVPALPDGKQWIYPILFTDQAIENWTHLPRVLLSTNSPITWHWIYDDQADTGFIYVFGLVPSSPLSNRNKLYVARADASSFFNYEVQVDGVSANWEFLHRISSAGGPIPDWRRGNDSLSTMWPIADNVTQEFSIQKISIRGVKRWLLAHSYWGREGMDDRTNFFSMLEGYGILRVSKDTNLWTFPDEEENFYWVDIKDIELEYNQSVEYGGFGRGFSLHADLSSSLRAGEPPPPAGSFPVVVGYTIFQFEAEKDPPPPPGTRPDSVWIDRACAERLDGRHCGARRFAYVDLAPIWFPPKTANIGDGPPDTIVDPRDILTERPPHDPDEVFQPPRPWSSEQVGLAQAGLGSSSGLPGNALENVGLAGSVLANSGRPGNPLGNAGLTENVLGKVANMGLAGNVSGATETASRTRYSSGASGGLSSTGLSLGVKEIEQLANLGLNAGQVRISTKV